MNDKSSDFFTITDFLYTTFQQSGKTRGVIAVSGGIDSAVSCTLLTQALGVEAVFPVLLPCGDQSTEDSLVLLDWLQIPESNRRVINIKSVVEELVKTTNKSPTKIRLGNLMARSRMILLYDVARELDGLVCGTENKSEKYLGYFTRFGDEASDIEPIQHMYKTQIFELASELQIPTQIIKKAPSAGLWPNQTDEKELGFSYHDADVVLRVLVDDRPEFFDQLIKSRELETVALMSEALLLIGQEISTYLTAKGHGLPLSVITQVLQKVRGNWFKQEVPYTIANPH